MTRDEQPNPPAQLAPGAITRGGAEKTTFTAAPEFTDRLRELAERDGGKLLPGRTEADAALFAALTAPTGRVPSRRGGGRACRTHRCQPPCRSRRGR